VILVNYKGDQLVGMMKMKTIVTVMEKMERNIKEQEVFLHRKVILVE
jgi:hypothetical protein